MGKVLPAVSIKKKEKKFAERVLASVISVHQNAKIYIINVIMNVAKELAYVAKDLTNVPKTFINVTNYTTSIVRNYITVS